MKLLSDNRKKASYNATQINAPPTMGVEMSFFTTKSTKDKPQVIIAAEMPNISQILYNRYWVDHGSECVTTGNPLPALSKLNWGITKNTGTIQMHSTDQINCGGKLNLFLKFLSKSKRLITITTFYSRLIAFILLYNVFRSMFKILAALVLLKFTSFNTLIMVSYSAS